MDLNMLVRVSYMYSFLSSYSIREREREKERERFYDSSPLTNPQNNYLISTSSHMHLTFTALVDSKLNAKSKIYSLTYLRSRIFIFQPWSNFIASPSLLISWLKIEYVVQSLQRHWGLQLSEPSQTYLPFCSHLLSNVKTILREKIWTKNVLVILVFIINNNTHKWHQTSSRTSLFIQFINTCGQKNKKNQQLISNITLHI